MSEHTNDLRVETIPVSTLKPYPANARTHSKKQIGQIADSIGQFGFTNPVLIDRDGQIMAGHGRVAAAKLLNLKTVPAIRLEHLSDAEKRAYVIADNRLAELAGWDRETLAIELQNLTISDISFNVAITGFETPEIDLLIEELDTPGSEDDADQVPERDSAKPPVTASGDLWQLGRHRLLCADATKPASFERLMNGEQAQLVFTDPPYNVPIDGHVSGLGDVKHAEFAMASGEMSETQFTAFLDTVFGNLTAHSVDGSIHFVCMDWRHLFETIVASRSAYTDLKNLCIWNKTNGGMGSLYRSKHELVFVFKSGTAPHINNVELGKFGRYRTNVWDYAGINSFGADRDEALAMHPTVKPTALVADAIKDCSARNGIVLDAFAGSGTTIIAAEKTGRRARALELDPGYVDIAIERWQQRTGKDAVHIESGFTFDELR
jgi:DNA modification methylase